jgi:hypothetical protein
MSELLSANQLVDLHPYQDQVDALYPDVVQAMNQRPVVYPPIGYIESPDGAVNQFRVWGILADAKTVIANGLPATVELQEDAFALRSAVEQRFWGPETCVIDYQTYAPGAPARLKSKQQRQEVGDGDYRAQADRLAAILRPLDITNEQQLIIKGHSGGADLAIEFTYQNLNNPSYGLKPVDALGALEPARSQNMLRSRKLLNFLRSGDDLFDNIVDSDFPQLLEAHGITPHEWLSKLALRLRVGAKVGRYALADLRGNFALLSGYSTGQSVAQLNDLATLHQDQAPLTVVGRVTKHSLTGDDLFAALIPTPNLRRFELEGDHSIADNLKMSVLFSAVVAGELQKASS